MNERPTIGHGLKLMWDGRIPDGLSEVFGVLGVWRRIKEFVRNRRTNLHNGREILERFENAATVSVGGCDYAYDAESNTLLLTRVAKTAGEIRIPSTVRQVHIDKLFVAKTAFAAWKGVDCTASVIFPECLETLPSGLLRGISCNAKFYIRVIQTWNSNAFVGGKIGELHMQCNKPDGFNRDLGGTENIFVSHIYTKSYPGRYYTVE